jgi:hypothetical protein
LNAPVPRTSHARWPAPMADSASGCARVASAT